MNKLSFGWKQYWKPTPVLIRKIADAIVAAAAMAGTFVTVNTNPSVGAAITLIGVLAKLVSNFFGETLNTADEK